jgi:3-deoxy-D-manno-octulosonate 8-phosphate phosphatase (KDO 8-P phosphatase)
MVSSQLSTGALMIRAAKIKLVLTDCDGVLTDGAVYYSSRGEEMRRFSVVDGMGVQLLRAQGIEVGIISGENSEIIRRRAEKLRLDPVFLGIESKLECAREIITERGLNAEHVAYIGDDTNDLPLMRFLHSSGLTGCPSNAHEQLFPFAHYQTARAGGHGAFREFANMILSCRGQIITDEPVIPNIEEVQTQ